MTEHERDLAERLASKLCLYDQIDQGPRERGIREAVIIAYSCACEYMREKYRGLVDVAVRDERQRSEVLRQALLKLSKGNRTPTTLEIAREALVEYKLRETQP